MQQSTSETLSSTQQYATASAEITNPEFLISAAVITSLALGAAGGYFGRKLHQKRTALQNKQMQQKEIDETVVTRKFSHAAAQLAIRSIFADVTIATGSEQIEVDVTGKTKRIDALKVTPSKNALTLWAEPELAIPASTIENERLLSDGVIGWFLKKLLLKGMNIRYVQESDRLTISVVVPQGTDLTLMNTKGKQVVKGEIGDLTLHTSYNKQTTVENVRGINIKANDSSSVRVGKVSGPAQIHTGYNSKVYIAGGTAPTVNAKLDIFSTLVFEATANGANVKTGYNSTAAFARVNGDIVFTADSSSHITARGGEAESVRIKSGYNSSVIFGGSALRLAAQLGSSSKAAVGSASDYLQVDAGYNSGRLQDGNIACVTGKLNSSSSLRVNGIIATGNLELGRNSVVQARGYGRDVAIKRSSSCRVETIR